MRTLLSPLQTLLEKERSYLNYFFDHIETALLDPIFEHLKNTTGTLFITGVGKSAHIAQKIAKTLLSTGTKAAFLSAEHALHGDLGAVEKDDTVLLFSKSGASEELLQLLPHIHHRKAFSIAVTSSSSSQLAKSCTFYAHLPLQKELCPFNLAPTTSSTLQLIFGDCLSIALMQAKRFTKESFAQNHPGGLLGKKLTLKVCHLMRTRDAIPKSHLDTPLIKALHELSAKSCGCLLILDDQERLQGIFTDGDLRRALETLGAPILQKPLSSLMSPKPKTVSPHLLALDALRIMEEKSPVTVLPVLEDSKLVGLLHMHDVMHAGLHGTP